MLAVSTLFWLIFIVLHTALTNSTSCHSVYNLLPLPNTMSVIGTVSIPYNVTGSIIILQTFPIILTETIVTYLSCHTSPHTPSIQHSLFTSLPHISLRSTDDPEYLNLSIFISLFPSNLPHLHISTQSHPCVISFPFSPVYISISAALPQLFFGFSIYSAMSSPDIIIHGDSSLFPSVKLSINTVNRKGFSIYHVSLHTV